LMAAASFDGCCSCCGCCPYWWLLLLSKAAASVDGCCSYRDSCKFFLHLCGFSCINFRGEYCIKSYWLNFISLQTMQKQNINLGGLSL
jgi:hypothetical protein